MTDINALALSVENMKTDMAKIGVLVDRLDTTIEKLTEVSSNVSQLLAVQVSKLEFQEKEQARLQAMVDQRQKDTDKAIEKIYTRIDEVEEDVKDEILTKLDDISDSLDKQDQRINKLERYIWIAIGIATSISMFLDKINFSALF